MTPSWDDKSTITLRTAHFPEMTIELQDNNSSEAPLLLVLDVRASLHDKEAPAAKTSDGPRKLSLTLNQNSAAITITETRGDNTASMEKTITLPYGSYRVIQSERFECDIFSLHLEIDQGFQVQTGLDTQGDLIGKANRLGRFEDVAAIKRRMKKTLALGQHEHIIAWGKFTSIRVPVPDCDRSKFTNMNEFADKFDTLRLLQTNNDTNESTAVEAKDPIDPEELARQVREDFDNFLKEIS